MTLDLAKIKSDAEIIASRCDTLLMPLPVKDVLGMLALIADKSEPCDGCFMADAEALRKDAERYRWLRSRPVRCPTSGPDLAVWDDQHGDAVRGDEADMAIDSAMAKERP